MRAVPSPNPDPTDPGKPRPSTNAPQRLELRFALQCTLRRQRLALRLLPRLGLALVFDEEELMQQFVPAGVVLGSAWVLEIVHVGGDEIVSSPECSL